VSNTEQVITGCPDFYRGKAREMLSLALWAVKPEDKTEYLKLAEDWLRLAEKAARKP
jgi:hypothetical protein